MQHHVVPMLYQHQVQGIIVSPVPVKVVHVKTIETFRRMGNGQDITGETMEPIKPKPAPQSLAIVLVAGRLDNFRSFQPRL